MSINFVTLSGNDYEIGLQQGKAVRKTLNQAVMQMPNFIEVKSAKPRLMPTSLYMYLIKSRAIKPIEKDIFQYYPKQAERFLGIARGAEIDLSWVLFAQSMEILVASTSSITHIPACTSLGFSPQRTKMNETIIAKNFDYPNHFFPYHFTCLTKPKVGYQTLGCKMAPLPGMLDGMNEHGLTVTYNTAFSTEEPKYFAPLSLALQEMLELCQNTEEAIKFIVNAKYAGNSLLMLADDKNDMRTIELSHNHSTIRELTENQMINTNHYLTQEMQKYEIPRNAVFSGKASKEWVGIRLHESSVTRLKRAQDLLYSESKIDEKSIISVLRDHGNDNHPSNSTICQHGGYSSTLRSVIFYPNKKKIKVLYGKPCMNEFSEFSFQ